MDLSAERYLGKSGIVAAGLFAKQIVGYMVETVRNDVAEYPGFRIETPVNGDDTTVYGIELNWQQSLDMLPGAWSGLQL